MGQIVPDPEFLDPTAWKFHPHWFTGGQCVIPVVPSIRYTYALNMTLVPGVEYLLTVNCVSVTADLVHIGAGNEFYWRSDTHGAGITQVAFTFDGLGIPSIFISATSNASATLESLFIEIMHARQLIREAVELAVTGLATTSTRVFPSKVYNLQESQLPALQVISAAESIELDEGTLDAPARLFDVVVKGTAQATSNVDNTLDDIAEEVETALGADITLGGLSHGLDLVATDFDYSGEGDQPIGNIELTYRVAYRTPFGDPTTVT